MVAISKRVIDDRSKLLDAILSDMAKMDCETFVAHFADHRDEYLQLPPVVKVSVSRKPKPKVSKVAKLTRTTAWEVFAKDHVAQFAKIAIAEKSEESEEPEEVEKLSFEQVSKLRKEASDVWKTLVTDESRASYHERAKVMNDDSLSTWRSSCSVFQETPTEIASTVEKFECIKDIPKKKLVMLLASAGKCDDIDAMTSMKYLRAMLNAHLN